MPNSSKAFTSKLGSVGISTNGGIRVRPSASHTTAETLTPPPVHSTQETQHSNSSPSQKLIGIEGVAIENNAQSRVRAFPQPSSYFFSSLGRSTKVHEWDRSLKAPDRFAAGRTLASDSSSKLSLSERPRGTQADERSVARGVIGSSYADDQVNIAPPSQTVSISSSASSLRRVPSVQSDPLSQPQSDAELLEQVSAAVEKELATDEFSGARLQVESEINDMIHDLESASSNTPVELEDLDADLKTILTLRDSEDHNELANDSDFLSNLFEDPQISVPRANEPHYTPLSEQFDHIISHFAGNNRDRDDIAALPLAAALVNAAGLQGKSTFFYNNSVGQPSVHEFVKGMRQGAEFAETLGIRTYDYETGLEEGTQRLSELFNSGQKILVLEGGHMEMTYRALENTAPTHLTNVALLSHSKFNEDYSTGGTRTWSDLKRRFPTVRFLQIRDQTIGLRSNEWGWLGRSDSLVLRQTYALMQNAQQVVDAPCDAGMHLYIITGNDRATPLDVQAFTEATINP